MRKPERIPEILLELYKLWSTMPDMRFGQLLFAIGYLEQEATEQGFLKTVDPFHYEDNILLDKIKAYEQR